MKMTVCRAIVLCVSSQSDNCITRYVDSKSDKEANKTVDTVDGERVSGNTLWAAAVCRANVLGDTNGIMHPSMVDALAHPHHGMESGGALRDGGAMNLVGGHPRIFDRKMWDMRV